MKRTATILVTAALCGAAQAKVDLVTIPTRDTVQLTIYNSADMTLVREQRDLTLKEGDNKLQFSWENTLIDPTSLEMIPKANADRIDIQDLVYPPRVNNLGLWNVNSRISGKSPVEISYLTSGLSWRAFYMGTLSPDETSLRLQGYVRVTNNSGEDYENAQVRLIVGQVHLIDQIAQLAQQQPPYGRPGEITLDYYSYDSGAIERPKMKLSKPSSRIVKSIALDEAPKEIVKEGLSEYFLYTIEGTETIPNTWSKRLPSFDVSEIPVKNLYKYEEDRYGMQTRRFLSFTNDTDHALGETPIPGGAMKVYRSTGENEHLAYEGQSNFKYIPVGEKVELDLGGVQDVIVEPKLMKVATGNFRFNNEGNVSGWDTTYDFRIEVRNTRNVPVKVEIKRNFHTPYWTLEKAGDFGTFEKDDSDTVKFTLELPAESVKTFTYTLTTRLGENRF
ncbi:MAG: DUF4139 domain-containing protein [Pontiellaceae bacterium]|nr:DUF4139 domain-containing protein [Pontiellaceae bacterium]MBN2783306.1 DUF4139 domain-containing protein [Pontiellaceae bacterium]